MKINFYLKNFPKKSKNSLKNFSEKKLVKMSFFLKKYSKESLKINLLSLKARQFTKLSKRPREIRQMFRETQSKTEIALGPRN